MRAWLGWRYVLFAALSLLLLVAAFSFAAGGESRREALPESPFASARLPIPSVAKEAIAHVRRLSEGLRPSARRFLRAFFRYEVGEMESGVASALRETTTSDFGRELLRLAPRPPTTGLFPLPARLDKLKVLFISPRADRAVVNGEALRVSSGERFSFVFVLSPTGAWLASGGGE